MNISILPRSRGQKALGGLLVMLLAVTVVMVSVSPLKAAGPVVYGLNATNQLLSFDRNSPSKTLSKVNISGLAAGETMLDIDFRPANGQLYGVGSTSQIYTIDLKSGAATKVGGPFTPTLDGTKVGLDFNPTVDRIRLVTDKGQNLRLHPDTGAVAATDKPLAYAETSPNAGKSPKIVSAAYTNSFAGATSTTLYNIDADLDSLVTQLPPNDGVLNTVGTLQYNLLWLGLFFQIDTKEMTGFDIGAGNVGLVALVPSLSFTPTSQLYQIELSSGVLKMLGNIGSGEQIIGLAIPIGS